MTELEDKLNCCSVDSACVAINWSFERFCSFYERSEDFKDITPACIHHYKRDEFDVNKCWNSEALALAKMEML